MKASLLINSDEKDSLVKKKFKREEKTEKITGRLVIGCCSIQTCLVLIFVVVMCILLSILCGLYFGLLNKPSVTLSSLFSQTNVYCGFSCAQICLGSDVDNCFDNCYQSCNSNAEEKFNKGVLSHYIQPNAVQHVGITVVNLTRATNFFVEMLGGVLVDGAGGDGWYGDSTQYLLTQKELLEADRNNETMKDMQIADLYDDGCDRLAATYVNFGSLQVELLDYRARDKEKESCSELPYLHHSTSPTVKNNMHIAFRIKDDVDLNQFVIDFEKKCADHGYPEVECNRITKVESEEERKRMGTTNPEYNSFEVVDESSFDGWGITYCKGVESLQVEFNTVKRNAKTDFDTAFLDYIS